MDFVRRCLACVGVAPFDITHVRFLLRDAFGVVSLELVKAELDNAVLVIARICSKAYGDEWADEVLVAEIT